MAVNSRNRPGGFTLLELMVVVTIIGVLASVAGPSIGAGFADRRVAMIARDVVSLFQRARYLSMAHGRAHQVLYENGGGFGLARGNPWAFETLRGTSAGCALTSFENAGGTVLADMDCGANWRCVDSLYPETYDPDSVDDDIVRVDGWNNSTFCYEAGSNSQVFVDNVLFANWQVNPVQAGFGFLVYRQVDGDLAGVPRKVLIPSGTGTPRILR